MLKIKIKIFFINVPILRIFLILIHENNILQEIIVGTDIMFHTITNRSIVKIRGSRMQNSFNNQFPLYIFYYFLLQLFNVRFIHK